MQPGCGKIALSMRVQDKHGLPYGSVSLPHLLGQQEKDPQNAGSGNVRPGDSGSVRARDGKGCCSSPAGRDRIAFVLHAAALGLILVVFVIRKYSRKAPAIAGASLDD